MNELTIFGLERLEGRVLLAVNITQNGGSLTITGDGDDNVVHIFNDGGDVRVLVDEDDDGFVDIDETYSGVTNIKIDTRGGDDYVGVSYLSIAGTLDIKTGAGYDEVRVGPYVDPLGAQNDYGDVSIGKDLKIDTGSHDDVVRVYADEYDTSIGGKLEIKTQGGHDDVIVSAAYDGELDVNKDVKIDTGGGYDEAIVYANAYSTVDIDGKLEIKTGANPDFVYVGGEGYLYIGKDLHIDTGGGSSSGYDFVVVYAGTYDESYGRIEVGGNVHINTHNSDDRVDIVAGEGGEIDIGKDLDIHTGLDSGDDLVQIVAFDDGRIEVGRHLNVHTHNGDDVVLLIAAEGGEIAVYDSTHIDLGNAGTGVDVFQAGSPFGGGSIDFYGQFHLHQHNGQVNVYADEYVTFHDDASFDGGNDYDFIDVYDATFLGDLDIKNFETIIP